MYASFTNVWRSSGMICIFKFKNWYRNRLTALYLKSNVHKVIPRTFLKPTDIGAIYSFKRFNACCKYISELYHTKVPEKYRKKSAPSPTLEQANSFERMYYAFISNIYFNYTQ